ncbi:hypothetical protein QYF36_002308 [Acer negundo]|nr:hypothetical protein QYF36_002308 [Acer negundo]
MEFDQWKTGSFGKISGGQGPGHSQNRRLPLPWLRPPLVNSTSNPCFKAEQNVQGMLVCDGAGGDGVTVVQSLSVVFAVRGRQ